MSKDNLPLSEKIERVSAIAVSIKQRLNRLQRMATWIDANSELGIRYKCSPTHNPDKLSIHHDVVELENDLIALMHKDNLNLEDILDAGGFEER